MEKRLAETLFLVMFGLCLSFATYNVLKSICPYGVGHVLKEGLWVFIVRASFVAVMFCFASFCFIFAIRFCAKVKPDGFIGDFLNVLTILLLAMSPWLCDHIARVIFLPFQSMAIIREEEFKYVDFLFVLIYGLALGALFLLRAVWVYFKK